MKQLRLPFILTLAALAPSLAFAATFENSSHQMAAGNFLGDGDNEIAYIKSTGAPGPIFIHAFNTGPSKLLPGVTAKQVIAANIDGVGGDELVFIDGVTSQLRSYNFSSKSFSTHTTAQFNTIQDVTAGQIDGDARIELLVARADNTAMIFYDAGTNLSFSAAGGGAGNNVAANFNNNGLTDFAVRNGPNSGSGSLYTLLDPYGGFTSLGGGLVRIATGNLDGASDPADEVYLTNAGNLIYTHGINGPNSFYVQTTGAGTDPTIGHLETFGDGRDLAYVLGTDSRVYEATTAWNLGSGPSMTYTLLRTFASINGSAAALGNTTNFFDILAADTDRDGLDELYLRKTVDGGLNLYSFRNGDLLGVTLSVPSSLPEPASATLLGLGAALAMLRRRR